MLFLFCVSAGPRSVPCGIPRSIRMPHRASSSVNRRLCARFRSVNGLLKALHEPLTQSYHSGDFGNHSADGGKGIIGGIVVLEEFFGVSLGLGGSGCGQHTRRRHRQSTRDTVARPSTLAPEDMLRRVPAGYTLTSCFVTRHSGK
eukprot:scaffold102524_cov77-Phaeocystis_antarctica.AAC.2